MNNKVKISKTSKIIKLSIIVILVILSLIMVFLFHFRKIENVDYCQGDTCFGKVKVYKNANTQSKCDLVGGRYEPLYIIAAKQDTGYCHVK